MRCKFREHSHNNRHDGRQLNDTNESKNRGVDSRILLRDTKWTGSTTRCVKTQFADGKTTFFCAGPYGGKAINEVEFESSRYLSRELITLDLRNSVTADQVTKVLNATDANIFDFNDETQRGEVFEREYFRSYAISSDGNNFRVNVVVHALAWSALDTYEDRSLVGSEEGAYLPDGLSDYEFSYYLEISKQGEMLDFDCKRANEKSWIFLDDSRISSDTILELWAYSGFACPEEDERREEALSLFLNSEGLSKRHRLIRERLRSVVSM